MTYQLSIITPNGKLFDDQIEFLKAKGSAGELGILARHAPLITTLKKGVLAINQKIFFAINSGILEADGRGHVVILADDAVPV